MRASRPRYSRLLGFTLVELLVVIGIIALLISILLPALGKARAMGQRSQCTSNLRQIGTAMLMYSLQNKGYFFPAGNSGYWDDFSGNALSEWDTRAYWGVAYMPFVGAKEGGANAEGVQQKARSMWRCPSSRVFPDPGYSDQEKTPCAFGLNIEVSGKKTTHFKQSAEIIVAHDAPEQLLDGNGDWLTSWERGSGGKFIDRGQNIYQWRDPSFSWYMGDAGIHEYYRHLKYCNVLWLDTHVDGQYESMGTEVPLRYYTGSNP